MSFTSQYARVNDFVVHPPFTTVFKAVVDFGQSNRMWNYLATNAPEIELKGGSIGSNYRLVIWNNNRHLIFGRRFTSGGSSANVVFPDSLRGRIGNRLNSSDIYHIVYAGSDVYYVTEVLYNVSPYAFPTIMNVTHSGSGILAGGNNLSGFVNGPKASARFSSPAAITPVSSKFIGNFPDNYYLIADRGNHCIRYFSISADDVGVFSGTNSSGLVDGNAATARFNNPNDVVEGPDGYFYVADRGNARVRRVAIDGSVTTLPGVFTYAYKLAIDGDTLYVICSSTNPRTVYAIPPSSSGVFAGGTATVLTSNVSGSDAGLYVDGAGFFHFPSGASSRGITRTWPSLASPDFTVVNCSYSPNVQGILGMCFGPFGHAFFSTTGTIFSGCRTAESSGSTPNVGFTLFNETTPTFMAAQKLCVDFLYGNPYLAVLSANTQYHNIMWNLITLS